MTDKRQATTQAAWVASQPMQPETSATRTPSVRGEISTGRILGFLALAVMVALAVGYLAFAAWGINAGLAWFVVLLLTVFTPFFLVDSAMSSGLLHRRAELNVELAKVDLATLEAARINEAQQAQLNEIYDTLAIFDERLKAVETIKVVDQTGARHIPKHDNVDIRIAAWLHQTMFDANGMLVGAHKSGHLIGPYPFKGDEEEAQTAHRRLVKATLIGKAGNNYTWIGPSTLSATKRQLEGK